MEEDDGQEEVEEDGKDQNQEVEEEVEVEVEVEKEEVSLRWLQWVCLMIVTITTGLQRKHWCQLYRFNGGVPVIDRWMFMSRIGPPPKPAH